MTDRVDSLKEQLRSHRVYSMVDSPEALRAFMERHVVCVWDFMSLLKSLQADIAGSSVPWLPPADTAAARLINEIVLDEETDELGPGRFSSHFDLYRGAMHQVGASTGAIDRVIEQLRGGLPVDDALASAGLPPACVAFSRTTFGLVTAPLHVRAAVFLHGREEVIPPMFIGLVRSLKATGIPCDLLLEYLDRHIETDATRHTPLARQLLLRLCAGDAGREAEANAAAAVALQARISLWDALAAKLHGSKASSLVV